MRSLRLAHAAPLVAIVVAIGVAGCSDTAVLLEVSSDRNEPQTALDGFCLGVAGGGTSRFARRVATASSPLPQTLTVFGGPGKQGLGHAIGLRHGQAVVETWSELSFQGGKTLRETLPLDRCPPVHPGPLSFDLGATRAASTAARAALYLGPDGPETTVLDGGASARLAVAPTAFSALPDPGPGAATALVATDLDGDCQSDLLLLGAGDPELRRSQQDGSHVTDGAALPPGPAAGAAVGDLDGDGNPDVVLCGGASIRVLLAAGRSFTPLSGAIVEPQTDAVNDATACALADLDGDGHLDLVVGQGSTNPGRLRVYFNDAAGTGHLTYAPGAAPQLAERTSALALGDVDNDGDIDLIAAHLGGPVRLYLNRGDGLLEDRSFGRLPDMVAADVPSLLLYDLDADCAPDLVVPRAGEAPHVWRNDGQGDFIPADSLPMPGRGDAALASALDVDGDGLPDLLLSGGAQGLALFHQRPR